MELSTREKRIIAISSKRLVLAAYLYMVIPIVIFFIGWLKLGLGSILSGIVLYALYYFIKRRYKEDEIFNIEQHSLFLMILIIIIWVFLSGMGGYFCQRSDWHYRNALLRDLIDYTWPVIYPETGNGLVYYYTFWMVPALFGKVFGWEAANMCLFLWTCIGILLSMLLICKLLCLDTLKKVAILLCLYLGWSGLNLFGMLVMGIAGWGGGGILGGGFGWADGISGIQYTPNNALLEWVFNQTIVPWVAVPLFLQDKRMDILAYLGLCVLPFAPLPFVGFFVICLSWALSEMFQCIRKKEYGKLMREVLSIPNIVAVLSMLTVFGLLFSGNAATNGSTGAGGIGWYIDPGNYTGKQLFGLLLFYVLEFLVYSMLIYKEYKHNLFFYVINISLLICPLIRVGTGRDFCMRASIPALFVLMIMIIKRICEIQTERLTTRTGVLIAVIAVSSLSAIGDWGMSLQQIIAADTYPIVADDVKSLCLRAAGDELNFLTECPEQVPFFKYLAKDKTQKDLQKDFQASEKFREQRGLPIPVGNYVIAPKSDEMLCLASGETFAAETGTTEVLLAKNASLVEISAYYDEGRYKIKFPNEHETVLDVPYAGVDEAGTVWTCLFNQSVAQRWMVEITGDAYMICWNEYALTYDLEAQSVKLKEKTGEENQQWLLSRTEKQ